MKTKQVIAAAVVLLGLSATGSTAEAQSARCGALVSELRSLGGAGGAAEAARRKVAALEKRSAAFGCANTRATGRPRECAGIGSQLNTARRQAAAGGGGESARRKRVQAELARLRCAQAPAAPAQRDARATTRDAAAASAKARPRYVEHGGRVVELGAASGRKGATGGGIFSMLFGSAPDAAPTGARAAATPTLTRLRPDATAPAPGRGSVADDGTRTYARGSFGGGSYRTLCVRSCDGYYFPISAVTSRGNFQRDETVCRALCPRTEVALYAHPVGSESERMHAITDGMPYEALPAAFQYRKAMDQACTCAFEAQLVVTADGRTAIDVDAIIAYSPATTPDAAAAIAAVTAATAAADGSLLTPADGAGGPTAANGDGNAGGIEIEASPGANPTSDGLAQPTTAPLETAAMPPPAAPEPAAPAADAADEPPAVAAIPTLAVLPTGELVSPAGPAAPAIAETAATPAVATVLTAGSVGPQQDVGGAAPRAQAVPATTRPSLRVRTIGPAFLQNQ